mmetsp:Transcript_3880/g.5967  ORF Transcript_3880/g.5967 Transcript_3880/m.5967 type:complete len:1464 (+) Transcript_3880:108-4499(+)|eukprot:CAMPEP_0201721698 /NCGR_PEP_ID=MMETSP0593-20130828/6310_1 /ASSEMBLY_ACC=CAM_ASM_000672 /TAXON_ID=267983 /ORGANISM="Skeletonema japonicum, Strain CCMP2506" /LENGTH=1463 /DNA_ID=CAMNT_0048212559 /DNA_START=63 /DNA_END=4457 /DNA_ORIENTATION=+
MPPEASHAAENSPSSTDEKNNDANTTMEVIPLENSVKGENSNATTTYGDEVEYADIDPEALSFEDQASCLSSWFLFYLTPLLKLGATKILDSKDVGPPSKCDRAKSCYDSVNTLWVKEVERTHQINAAKRTKHEEALAKCGDDAKKIAKLGSFTPTPPNLAMVLWRAFGQWQIIWAIALYVISSLLQFLPVLILNDLVKYFESGSPSDYRALLFHPWGDVVGLLVFPLMVALLQTRSQVIFNHCAIFIRTAVSNLLFSKALTISAAGRAQTSTGQVVNMMSNDTTQLQRFLQFVGFTLVAPIQIIIALVLIYGQVGNATWVGVGFMLCLIPINGVVFANVSKQRRRVLKYSDARVKMVNEVLAGIRIIKFYAWEKPFGKELNRLRDKELKALTQLAYTSAVGFSLIMLSAPIINPILVFLVYISTGSKPLDAATAFTTIALFNIMRFPFAFLPMGFLQYVQSKIALKRLSRYLELSELNEYVVPDSPPTSGSDTGLAIDDDDKKSDPAIILDGGSFSWVDPDATPVAPKPEKPKRMTRKERRASRKALSVKQKEDESKTVDMKSHPSNASMSRAESLASLGVSVRTVESEEENTREARIALKNIACSIERGSLVAIVGSVGSGKSSFLSAVLGEMESIDGGKVYMPPKDGEEPNDGLVSYCSQSPWVVNDTLRGNILFGRPYVEERYNEVVSACALLDDLAVLPAGDKTEIGERGINLSGGQKARIALARAMYSEETQLMLLDDPLSAVDAHVGEHLFKHAITGKISSGTTRVLVTHHVHFLPRCDKVIMLEKGEVKHTGSYLELVARGVDFAGAVDVSKKEKDEEAGDEDKEKQDESEEAIKSEKGSDATKAEGEKLKTAGEKLVKDEELMEGAVEGSMYTHYAKAGGVFAFVMVFIIQGVGRASEIMAAFWISIWAEATAEAMITKTPMTEEETNWYLNIYAAFGLGGVFCLTLRAIWMAIHRLRASKKLHDSLTDSILRAPVAFFDVTPIGRVLNRFAADMDKIDLELTNSLGQAVSTMFSVLGAVGAIVVATRGTLLVALVPIGYVNYVIQKWFRKSSTELQRAASVAASPIFSDFSQMLSGTSTIRAFGKQNKFFDHCQISFDKFNALFSAIQHSNFWLGLRLDALGGTVGAIIGGVALGTKDYSFIPAGWVGLALSYSIEVTGYLKHGVRMIAQVEAEMNSVERVLYYSTSIETEAALETMNDPKPTEWPTTGEIKFQNMSMRYRDGPLVLKDISVSFKGGEKVGVVGRTGSGKSSLMAALFRITEMEADGGKILIDGKDISQIGLSILRLNLSIIPQDPVMFSNTVRYNLDPFGEKSEYELWEALKKVQLAEAIAVLPDGLDEQVAEGGENFSQGQRQLLCIARSLLRKPKILVMDEATASIDNTTDASIQQMIRENFASATILTIAHRLNTIMDSDRVLVLDDGRVAEFDSPSALINQGGIFASMVEKSKKAHDA